MQVLDTSIANIALPHMQAALNATQESVTWVLTSYMLAMAVMTPLTGTLDNPPISEEGRAFLAGLLVQLSDAQIRALFEVARFPIKTAAPGDAP